MLSFLRPTTEAACRCSRCGRLVDMIVRLPVKGVRHEGLRGLLTAVTEQTMPWIGLCEPCCREITDGFAAARKEPHPR